MTQTSRDPLHSTLNTTQADLSVTFLERLYIALLHSFPEICIEYGRTKISKLPI